MNKTTTLVLTGLLMSGSTLAVYAADMPVAADAPTEYQNRMREWITGLGLNLTMPTDLTIAAPSQMANEDVSTKLSGSDEDDDEHDSKSLRDRDQDRTDRT